MGVQSYKSCGSSLSEYERVPVVKNYMLEDLRTSFLNVVDFLNDVA